MSNYGVIKFSDKLLARIEKLKKIVFSAYDNLSSENDWAEYLSASISYGGMKWIEENGVLSAKATANGPVLAYGHPNHLDMRCVDDPIRIHINGMDAYVESDHEEGSENPLGYDISLDSIPDVFFSEYFIRGWCYYIKKLHLSFNKDILNVVEDMPLDHRILFDAAVKEHLEYNQSIYEEEKALEQKILRESCNKFIEMSNKVKPFRLGLDFHGVIDDDPEYFSILSNQIINEGGEVHILTGSRDTPEFRNILDTLKIKYTHLFSISSHHEAIGTKVWEDEHGPWMNAEVWDRSKAEYCKENDIHLHFDDSNIYGKYFDKNTVYVKYPELSCPFSTTNVHQTVTL